MTHTYQLHSMDVEQKLHSTVVVPITTVSGVNIYGSSIP